MQDFTTPNSSGTTQRSFAPGDRVLLCAVSWATGAPAFQLRINDEPSTYVPVRGLSLTYSSRDGDTIRCIGHKPFRDASAAWVDCDRTPLHDGNKCDRCAANDATFASQLHHAHTRGAGELDAAVQSHLNQQNHLYLAAFRDGSIKVGTSTSHRLQTRLAEQGAWRAAVVASTSNGVTVRELEARVTDELGIPQSVSARRKLTGLVSPVPDVSLIEELARWRTGVQSLIASANLSDVEIPTETEPSAFWESPISGVRLWENVIEYPLKLKTGNHALDFLGASGRLCAFQRPGLDDQFVADPRPLFGRELVMAEVDPDELTVQDSLF